MAIDGKALRAAMEKVKRNQPQSYEEIMKCFDEMSEDYKKMKDVPSFKPRYPEMMKGYEETFQQEKNRDRYENRWYKICNDPFLLTKTQKEWPFLRTVLKIRQVRIPVERDSEENDITPNVETFLNQGSRRKPKPIRGDSEGSDIQDIGMIHSAKTGHQQKNQKTIWH